MHLAEGREPLAVVTAKEEVDALIGVYAEELPDSLDGEDLRVGELWRRAALANATILDLVVNEAEDSDDEGVKIHEKTSVLFDAIGLTPSVRGSSLSLKSSKKPAHEVSYSYRRYDLAGSHYLFSDGRGEPEGPPRKLTQPEG